MPSVATVSATMAGPAIGQGLTRMHWQNATGAVPTAAEVSAALTAMIGFWTAIANRVVAGIAIDPVDSAVVQDVASGLTTADVAASSLPAGIVCADTSPESVSGTGAAVMWRTGFRRRSRELRGRTFVIPMGSGQFAPTGNISGPSVTAIATAANNLTAAMTTAGLVQVVYGRPLVARGVHPALPGQVAPVTLADVSDVPAFLRRRRV